MIPTIPPAIKAPCQTDYCSGIKNFRSVPVNITNVNVIGPCNFTFHLPFKLEISYASSTLLVVKTPANNVINPMTKKAGNNSIIIPTAANPSPTATPTGIEMRKVKNGLKPTIMKEPQTMSFLFVVLPLVRRIARNTKKTKIPEAITNANFITPCSNRLSYSKWIYGRSSVIKQIKPSELNLDIVHSF